MEKVLHLEAGYDLKEWRYQLHVKMGIRKEKVIVPVSAKGGV